MAFSWDGLTYLGGAHMHSFWRYQSDDLPSEFAKNVNYFRPVGGNLCEGDFIFASFRDHSLILGVLEAERGKVRVKQAGSFYRADREKDADAAQEEAYRLKQVEDELAREQENEPELEVAG